MDELRKEDISRGIEAASAVLQRTNAAIDREERIEAVEELKTLVEDWKGHRIEGFGDLLLHGQFTVLKGEINSAKNEERDVRVGSSKKQVCNETIFAQLHVSFRTNLLTGGLVQNLSL